MAEAGAEHTASDDTSGNHGPPLAKETRELLESLDTGDLVLFDRPCLKMGGFFGAAVCAAAKVMGGSPFDHIGVVVKDENGLNSMVEASFSGVAVRPLCERIRRSSASQICVRRLQALRTEEMRAEARRFVSEVADLPYKEGGEGLLQMVAAAFRFHPAKEQRRRCHAETVALTTSIASLERELSSHPEAGDPTQDMIRERLRRAITRRRKALLFLDAATPPTPESPPSRARQQATSSTAPEGPGGPPHVNPVPPDSPGPHVAPPSPSRSSSPSASTPPPIFPPPYYDGGMFCSELVAALYQRLGLLDAPFPARHDYVPADFAQSLGNPTGCLGVDTGEDALLTNDAHAEAPAADSGDGRTTSASTDRTRRAQESGDEEARGAASLPPPIPEGGGRVALLRGAELGPGCWLRGGPPSPPSIGRKEDGGEGEEDGEGPERGGGGGRGPKPPPSAAAPTGTGASSSSRPRFSRKAVAAAPSAAVGGGPAAAAAVLGFVGTSEDRELWAPLLREMKARRQSGVGVGEAGLASRRCLLRWSSSRKWLWQASPMERLSWSGKGGRRNERPACGELSRFWWLPEPAVCRAVESPPSFPSPIGTATTTNTTTTNTDVEAAAAAAAVAAEAGVQPHLWELPPKHFLALSDALLKIRHLRSTWRRRWNAPWRLFSNA
eukprot:g4277.t1